MAYNFTELKQKIAELEELIREAYPLLEEVQTKFGSNAAARTVLIDALSDENLLARMAAFKSLTRVGGDGATRAFVRVLSEADDPLSRRAAVFALGELPDQNARKALENARSDRNSAVGEAAERALAQWDQQFGQ